jgi:drebrin-like protein
MCSLMLNSRVLIQNDVTPALIMSRVEAASGAKYSTRKEQTRQSEPIAPVGTAYTPVGKVDIAALRKAPPPAAKPTLPSSSSRPAFSALKPTVSAGSVYGRTVNPGSAPADAWPDEKPFSPPATVPLFPPAASRPPVLPTTNRPAFSAMVCICNLYDTRLIVYFPRPPSSNRRFLPLLPALQLLHLLLFHQMCL